MRCFIQGVDPNFASVCRVVRMGDVHHWACTPAIAILVRGTSRMICVVITKGKAVRAAMRVGVGLAVRDIMLLLSMVGRRVRVSVWIASSRTDNRLNTIKRNEIMSFRENN